MTKKCLFLKINSQQTQEEITINLMTPMRKHNYPPQLTVEEIQAHRRKKHASVKIISRKLTNECPQINMKQIIKVTSSHTISDHKKGYRTTRLFHKIPLCPCRGDSRTDACRFCYNRYVSVQSFHDCPVLDNTLFYYSVF